MRSRMLEFTTDPRTRPMKDRTREAVFNLLGGDLNGYLVADLFAGSGVLGFESLSRGAGHALLIEWLRPAAREIASNAERLAVTDRTTIVTADTFAWAEHLPQQLTNIHRELGLTPSLPWCVFICPPYRFWETERLPLLTLIQRWLEAIPSHSTMVLELDETTPLEILPAEIGWRARSYPPAVIAIGDKS